MSLKKRLKTLLALSALAILSGIAIGMVYFLVIFTQVSRNLPSLTEIGNFRPSEGTTIYYADGPPLAILKTENRRPVKLEEISKYLIAATLAAEDSRFYEHKGVDLRGVARAVFRNVSGGDLTGQGASTITQQLARNINELGLTKEKKLRRKVAEAILAMRIEQTFTKDEILENYLNQIYYGSGAYGVEAAALTYFHKHAKNLTLGQAAMLAGMPQRPSLFSENQDAALRRREWVLERMYSTGTISAAQLETARGETLKIYKAQPHKSRVFGAPYFVNYVVSQLVQAYGYDHVYSGLKIYTTLDSRIQKLGEEALRNGIASSDANQGALISVDPRTGAIRAMVGGVDFHRDQFNIAAYGYRQPGSSFKLFVYTAGIDSGTCDLDKSYRDDKDFPGHRAGDKWYPKNYSGKYSYSEKSVLSAIKFSLNTIAVKVAMETGLERVIDYARRMGITAKIDPYPTLALGASAVRPLELCSAYSLFANEGKRALPYAITRVEEGNGDILEEHTVKISDPALRPETVQSINTALQEVVLHGTGTAAADVPNAHGKTGTTSDNRDAWFAGYTPELSTVVWAGHEQRKKGKVVRYLEMPGTTGGHLCAPIWREFMQKAIPIQQAANKAAEEPKPTEAAEPKPEEKTPKEETKKHDATEKPAGEKAPAGDMSVPAQPETAPDGAETGDTPPAPAPSAPDSGPAPSVEESPAPTPTGLTTRGHDSAPRMSEPAGRLSAPTPRRTDTGDEMVTVSLCADSMLRATRWCTTTVDRRMRRRDVPGRCRTHHAPQGEGE